MSRFNDLKQTYTHLSIPEESIDSQWEELMSALPSRQRIMLLALLRTGMLVVITVFLVSGGVIGAAQASRPGSPLYPIKKISNDTYSAVKEKIAPGPEAPLEPKVETAPSQTPTITPTPSEEKGKENNGSQENQQNQKQNNGQSENNRNKNEDGQVQGASEEHRKNEEAQENPGAGKKPVQNTTDNVEKAIEVIKEKAKAAPKGLGL